jgi:hypothetical protein
MTLTSLNTNLPRYAVGRWLGEGALGMFSAMTYLTMVGTTLMGAASRQPAGLAPSPTAIRVSRRRPPPDAHGRGRRVAAGPR